ncbi:hypothetical protein [Suttonella ornithocola]|uniref:Tc1-like transposase DDE domain-containing protein n=1 Tax=Suttonella ornithocola TaxID=279832 RepID=A0A380MPD5_9GAMM|nr:hypothetical protein [Suttonella ornithocola]SUO94465.1 Uncharacterised protein [Suttonella ornithocola]
MDKTAQDKPIVYLDECGFKAFAHRAYGYSTKGQVCHGSDIVKSLIIQSIQSRYKEQLVVELSKTN